MVSIRLIQFRGVKVQETSPALKAMLEALAAEVTEQYKATTISEIPVVKAVRAIFHRTGVDPTRYRPSSEALIRRVTRGKGLYFINSAVDVVNYFSLKTLLPMGVFDADCVKPPLEFRAGREGETYQGVGRDELNLSGFPLLADAEGPFGSAVSDSVRTRVTDGTSSLLWATFVPPEVPPPDFDEFAATMIRFNGGAVDQDTVFRTA
ncbi:MAG TPA: phenylalanine--tRNA ligase beta subunit-related protein [Terriglobia bacterium]|nr:phenylalanine--tRNA ligase beta subunit-related protein [Terriglobia bacterium]